MSTTLRNEFTNALLRLRKVDVCFPQDATIQFGEMIVLSSMAENKHTSNRMSANEVCESLNISRPAVSQILNSLEKKGCITREIDAFDRRKINVSATEKGNGLLENALILYSEALDNIFEKYGEEKIKTLVQELNRLSDIYEQLAS